MVRGRAGVGRAGAAAAARRSIRRGGGGMKQAVGKLRVQVPGAGVVEPAVPAGMLAQIEATRVVGAGNVSVRLKDGRTFRWVAHRRGGDWMLVASGAPAWPTTT